jgi:hypothetical protein
VDAQADRLWGNFLGGEPEFSQIRFASFAGTW